MFFCVDRLSLGGARPRAAGKQQALVEYDHRGGGEPHRLRAQPHANSVTPKVSHTAEYVYCALPSR
jgi:hypothetical protein